jgi:EAL domain-containing protein (putative c-di-GMP-specific phosphodiesterase class I)
VYLQPKIYIKDEKLAGAEALVKWNLNSKIMSPSLFIPIFERNGFVTKLDMYVFEQVCIFLSKLMKMGKMTTKISVNFSRFHLGYRNFVSELCHIADKHGVPHSLLEVELTESAMLEDQNALLRVIDELHEHGFTLSIDDFGSGYSSLGLLKNMLVDVLKFDRSFLENSKDTERSWQIISSAIYMAKKLNIQVVAEGVEGKEHLEMLKKMGCDIVQGFYYSKPILPNEFISKYLN